MKLLSLHKRILHFGSHFLVSCRNNCNNSCIFPKNMKLKALIAISLLLLVNISSGQGAKPSKKDICLTDFKKCNEISKEACQHLEKWVDCSDKDIIKEIQGRLKECGDQDTCLSDLSGLVKPSTQTCRKHLQWCQTYACNFLVTYPLVEQQIDCEDKATIDRWNRAMMGCKEPRSLDSCLLLEFMKKPAAAAKPTKIPDVDTCRKDPMSTGCLEYGCQEMKKMKNLQSDVCTDGLKHVIIEAMEKCYKPSTIIDCLKKIKDDDDEDDNQAVVVNAKAGGQDEEDDYDEDD